MLDESLTIVDEAYVIQENHGKFSVLHSHYDDHSIVLASACLKCGEITTARGTINKGRISQLKGPMHYKCWRAYIDQLASAD